MPISELGLEPGHTTTINVSHSETEAMDCVSHILLSLPVEYPEIWEYARHYGLEKSHPQPDQD